MKLEIRGWRQERTLVLEVGRPASAIDLLYWLAYLVLAGIGALIMASADLPVRSDNSRDPLL